MGRLPSPSIVLYASIVFLKKWSEETKAETLSKLETTWRKSCEHGSRFFRLKRDMSIVPAAGRTFHFFYVGVDRAEGTELEGDRSGEGIGEMEQILMAENK